jgi:hypothetical protein
MAPRRRGRADERALAIALRDAGLDERAELEGLLRGAGFDLAHFTDFNTQGIAPGGHVFIATRRLDEVNELFGERWIDERMQVRNDTVTERRIWFAQIWFVMFSLFYTRRDRVTTEVSRYVETTFMRADLADAVRSYINDLVRKLGQEAIQDDAVYKCLTSESGMQIEQYCDRFLGLMVDGGMLDRLADDRYRQSLLSAAEMRNNHMQGLEPWLKTRGVGGNPLESGRAMLVRIGEQSETGED